MIDQSHSGEYKANVGSVARNWWEDLRPKDKNVGRRTGNAGAFAKLRRADLHAAMTEEVTSDLYRKLRPVTNVPREVLFERAALIAAVLPHVRDEDSRKVATAAGEKLGEQHKLHPLRLRRLFATRSAADCLIAFRRLVAVLDKKVNVYDLAESLFDWPDELRGDARRSKWAFHYYGADLAAPGDHTQAA